MNWVPNGVMGAAFGLTGRWMPMRWVEFLTFLIGDDPGSERCSGMAGHRPHRHAKRIPVLGFQVQEVLKRDPLSGHLFCFRGRRGDLLKVIWHDGHRGHACSLSSWSEAAFFGHRLPMAR